MLRSSKECCWIERRLLRVGAAGLLNAFEGTVGTGLNRLFVTFTKSQIGKET